MKRLLQLTLIGLLLALALPTFAQNRGVTIFSSAARTATTLNSADQINSAGNGVICVLDTTAFTSGTTQLTIQGKDGVSGKYYTLLQGATVGSVSTNVYSVCRGCPTTANVSANAQLPVVWRVNIAGASTPVSTYSVGCQVIQ